MKCVKSHEIEVELVLRQILRRLQKQDNRSRFCRSIEKVNKLMVVDPVVIIGPYSRRPRRSPDETETLHTMILKSTNMVNRINTAKRHVGSSLLNESSR